MQKKTERKATVEFKASNPFKIQSRIPGQEGEGVLIEDDDSVWAVEITPSPLVRTALDRMKMDRNAGDWERINPHLRRAKKRSGSQTS